MHKVKAILRVLGLTLFGIFIALIALEVFMRIGFDLLPPDIQGELQHVRRVPWDAERIVPAAPMMPSTMYQTVIEPGFQNYPIRWMDARFEFSTISLWEHPVGLRTDPQPKWPIDIMAFGDSFTFCWTEVEDCWVQLLESDYGWSIINAGQPGTGPNGQLPLIEQVAIPIEPSLVVWQWYSNDPFDDYVLSLIRGETTGLQGAPAPDPVHAIPWPGNYSAVYTLIYNRINPLVRTSSYKHSQLITVNGQRMHIMTNEYIPASHLSYPATQYGWELNIQAYERGIELLQEINIEVVFVLVPTKEEAYAEFLIDILGEEYLEEAADSRHRLMNECTERGWDCIDATPAFREAVNNGENVYYPLDFHLDASGNHILAKIISDYIIEKDLLPVR